MRPPKHWQALLAAGQSEGDEKFFETGVTNINILKRRKKREKEVGSAIAESVILNDDNQEAVFAFCTVQEKEKSDRKLC